MKLRTILILMFSLLSLLLSGCDLDILLEQALLLNDPVTFLGERQVQVKLSGSDLDKVKELELDLDTYIAQTLRETLPPAWEAAWSIENDAIILDFVLPFQGLEDYGMKVHQTEETTSYIDLAGSSALTFPTVHPPLLTNLGQEQDIGREIFTHEGTFLQAEVSGLATAYYEPVRHELYKDDRLLFYLSLGEPGHWTKADLQYLEVLPDLRLDAYFDVVRSDFADVLTTEGALGEDASEQGATGQGAPEQDTPGQDASEQGVPEQGTPGHDTPQLRNGSDLLILGEQVYETSLTENNERILRQSRVLPLELEVSTYSDDLLSFSRTLRLRLPQDPTGKSLLRLSDRLNLGILPDLSFQAEGNPQNRIESMTSKIEDVSLNQLRDYTRLLLGKEYDLELTETEDLQFVWDETFELLEFFSDQAGPQVKLQGLFTETLSPQSRSAHVELSAKRSWPAIALQTYWDKDAKVYVRRYHYYFDEAGTESILTDYLIDHSLEDYPIYSRSEDGYRHVFMEQRTTDPSYIAEQTSKLLGPTTIDFTESSGLSGKTMHWVENYSFDKIADDQVIHLAEGDSYQQLRQKETMPRSGILTLNLTLQTNLNLFLGLALVGLLVATWLHPRSILRASILKTKQRFADYQNKKQREIEERPLGWGATFHDHKGRLVKIISVEESEPEPRKILRFR